MYWDNGFIIDDGTPEDHEPYVSEDLVTFPICNVQLCEKVYMCFHLFFLNQRNMSDY